MGSSGGGNTTSVNVEKPWGAISNYLSNPKTQAAQDPLGMSSGIYDQVFYEYMPNIWDQMTALGEQGQDPYSLFYYNGDRVADMTPAQEQAIGWTKQYATDLGSTFYPVYDPMRETLEGSNTGEIQDAYNQVVAPTLGGEYLDPNSNAYLQKYAQAATDPIVKNTMENLMPSWDNQAVASGRYGSGAWQQGRSDLQSDMQSNIGNTLAQIYAPAYESERDRQMNATQWSPAVYEMLGNQKQGAADSFQDILNQEWKQLGYLSAAGEAEQAQSQADINAQMQLQEDQLYKPLDWANVIANMFMSGGSLGRTSSSTSPYNGPSMAQSLLGTGLSAASLYEMLQGYTQ